ncbi:MAG: hypothetical protein ACI4PU_02035 [Intestinibacter sp.]
MEQSVVMKSKVDISRNLNGYSFPHKLSSKEADIITEKIKNIIYSSKYDLILNKTSQLSQIELGLLLERELIDGDFLANENSAILTNHDKTICILINGLDHIKIQVVGYNGIKELYDIANEIDDLLESHLEYAFDKDLGYLTTCPVNVGTGLKVTNTVHIPSIQKLNQIDDYCKIAHKIGVDFKGVYGNTKSILGSLYKVSNSVMLGRSEENIIQSVESISKDLSKKEYEGREVLRNVRKIDVEDDVFRSLAILSSARVMTNTELMRCLSSVKLGIEMGYIEDVSLEKIEKLMTGRQPYLKIISAYDEEDKVERASYIRREFSLANRNNK